MLVSKVNLSDFSKQEILLACNERNNKRISTEMPIYSQESIGQAIDFQLKKKLNYNCKTGVTKHGNKWMSNYTDGKPPVYESMSAVLIWEFLDFIFNSASMITRGYKLC